ncbi:MAG: hypothetical protein ACR2M4_12450, partial [Actinomycetota bacterium]
MSTKLATMVAPQPLNAARLRQELQGAGIILADEFSISLAGDDLELLVVSDVPEEDDLPETVLDAINGVITNHTGTPTEQETELAALIASHEALVAKVQAGGVATAQ